MLKKGKTKRVNSHSHEGQGHGPHIEFPCLADGDLKEGSWAGPGIAFGVQVVYLPVLSESKNAGTSYTSNNGFGYFEVTSTVVLGDYITKPGSV